MTTDLENEIVETLTRLRIARIHRDNLRTLCVRGAYLDQIDATLIVAQRHLDRLLEQLGADNGQ